MENKNLLYAGMYGHVDVNQGPREFEVHAVIGDRALITYYMPAGGMHLVEVGTNLLDPDYYRWTPGNWVNRTWEKLPKRWKAAVEAADAEAIAKDEAARAGAK